MRRLNAAQLDPAVLLLDPLPVLPLEDREEPLAVARLLGDHPVVLLGAADLERLDGGEAVVEGRGGPLPHQLPDLAPQLGGDLRRAAGGQRVEDPLVGTPAPMLEDDPGQGGVLLRWPEGRKERRDNGFVQLVAQALGLGFGGGHAGSIALWTTILVRIDTDWRTLDKVPRSSSKPGGRPGEDGHHRTRLPSRRGGRSGHHRRVRRLFTHG